MSCKCNCDCVCSGRRNGERHCNNQAIVRPTQYKQRHQQARCARQNSTSVLWSGECMKHGRLACSMNCEDYNSLQHRFDGVASEKCNLSFDAAFTLKFTGNFKWCWRCQMQLSDAGFLKEEIMVTCWKKTCCRELVAHQRWAWRVFLYCLSNMISNGAVPRETSVEKYWWADINEIVKITLLSDNCFSEAKVFRWKIESNGARSTCLGQSGNLLLTFLSISNQKYAKTMSLVSIILDTIQFAKADILEKQFQVVYMCEVSSVSALSHSSAIISASFPLPQHLPFIMYYIYLICLSFINLGAGRPRTYIAEIGNSCRHRFRWVYRKMPVSWRNKCSQ